MIWKVNIPSLKLAVHLPQEPTSAWTINQDAARVLCLGLYVKQANSTSSVFPVSSQQVCDKVDTALDANCRGLGHQQRTEMKRLQFYHRSCSGTAIGETTICTCSLVRERGSLALPHALVKDFKECVRQPPPEVTPATLPSVHP